MSYFQNIKSLAELKKVYRRLALKNHPDRGGTTKSMQEINAEFARLFAVWKDDTTVSDTASGYENDYAGSSATEYAEYVYNEYRWKGSNYHGQRPPEICNLIRQWLKKTYPRYKFSVTRSNYDSIYIFLLEADFEPFTKDSGITTYVDLNVYHLDKERRITDRARDVMENVCSYAQSYNYDNSDVMTDYFDRNFYLNLGIGNYRKPYKLNLPKVHCRKEDAPKVFKHPEGPAHKAIRQALGKAHFCMYNGSRYKLPVLGEDSFGEDGGVMFWPLLYSSASMAQKRIDKLTSAGILCRFAGYNRGCIEFLGYTPQTEQALEREREEVIAAYEVWRKKNSDHE